MAKEDVMSKATGAKPLVQIACVCEKVLVEPDNVPTLVRVVDTYNVEVPPGPLPPSVQAQLNLTAFISLKSGDVVGNFEVGLRLTGPEGKGEPKIRKWPVEFRGAEAGVNLRIDFVLNQPKLGLYWWDVLWGDEVLTRIPFRLNAKEPAPRGDAISPTETALR